MGTTSFHRTEKCVDWNAANNFLQCYRKEGDICFNTTLVHPPREQLRRLYETWSILVSISFLFSLTPCDFYFFSQPRVIITTQTMKAAMESFIRENSDEVDIWEKLLCSTKSTNGSTSLILRKESQM